MINKVYILVRMNIVICSLTLLNFSDILVEPATDLGLTWCFVNMKVSQQRYGLIMKIVILILVAIESDEIIVLKYSIGLSNRICIK